MKPFLKSAWEERRKLHVEGDKLCTKADKLFAEGDELYVNRVLDYYDLTAIIDWDTGKVKGEILPIPAGELKDT